MPFLEVSPGAVWNVKGDVDGNGKIIPSSIIFSAKDKRDQQAPPQQYNLQSDLIYLKKKIDKNGVMWVEVKLKGCGGGKGPGPTRPERPIRPESPGGHHGKSHKGHHSKGHHSNGHHSKGHRSKGGGSLLEEDPTSIEDNGPLVELSEDVENSTSMDDLPAFVQLSQDTEDRLYAGKGKGRGSHGSRGAGHSQAGPTRPSRGTGQQECAPLTFADGTFYPRKGIEQALQNELSNAPEDKKGGNSGGWIQPSQSPNTVSMAPARGKGIFGALAFGTLGFLAVFPVVWVGHEEFLAAGPIGAVVGGLASAGVAMYKNQKGRKSTASETLYEKMHCLTKVKTCNGEACFKQCSDENGDEVIVPTHSDPPKGITC
jgi:hypothetical protein